MAYALHIYTSTTAGQTDFQFTFPYIKAEHVKLYVNYTEIAYAVATRGAGVAGFQVYISGGNTYARLNDTNGLGSANTRVEVRRISSLANVLVDYADGSTLTASDLDTSNLQHLYVSQEVDDALKQGVAIDPATGLPTLGSQRLTNVADPTSAQDAATKNYSDTTKQPLDAELTELATMSSGTAAALADLTATEVQAIDGITSSTNELNILDGVTASTAELNYVDGVTSNVQTQLNAKQPLDAELTELATMASDTASALADLTAAEVQAIDGITSSTSELNILDGVTATAAEINKLDGVTASTTEINYVDGVTSAIQTQLNAKQPLDAELTELATMASTTADALADLTNAEVTILDGATLTTTELNYVDGVTSSIQTQLNAKQPLDTDLTTLAGMQSGTASVLASATALTATTGQINGICTDTVKDTSIGGNSSHGGLATGQAVREYVGSVVSAVGGLVAIGGPTNFPSTQPSQGVVVSIGDVGGSFTVASQEITITNGAGSGNNVRITGFPSVLNGQVNDDTGLQVTSDKNNSTSGSPNVHRYVYHKLLATETDVAALSDDINDFNSRYRTGSSNPSSDNDAGDLFYNTSTDKMLVRNAANNAWEEVQSIGNFYLQSLSGFNGILNDFTIANPPSNAHQIILSINGVIQKPNAGTSRPSEGFALDGSTLKLSDAPASGDTNFYIIMGSAVNIGTPSNNTVSAAVLQNLAVETGKIANDAVTADKLADSINTEIAANTAKVTNATHTGEVTGATALTIADNVVDEANLKADNSPTNDYVLTAKSSAAGGLTWAAVEGGVSSDAQTNTVAGTEAGDSFSGTDANGNALFGYQAGTALTTGDYNIAIGRHALKSTTTSSQNVAVGVAALHDNATGGNNTAVGSNALNKNTASYNTACGNSALYANTSGTQNVAIGHEAIYTNTTANSNTAVGCRALKVATSGNGNVALGYEAGTAQTTAASNTFVGASAGGAITTGGSSVAVGNQALFSCTTGGSNVAVGQTALYTNTGGNNTAVGYQSMWANTSGGYNTAIGYKALDSNTTGDNNVALGYNLYDNTTGSRNTAVGTYALANNTTANNNTCVGYESLGANTTGTSNTAVGKDALLANTTGNSNTAIGIDALTSNTTGHENLAIGQSAMNNNETGSGCVGVGHFALYHHTTGGAATALGYKAAYDLTTGTDTVAIGNHALQRCTTGHYNVAVGQSAGDFVTTGQKNVMMGIHAGENVTTGSYNVCIGSWAGDGLETGISNVCLGPSAGSGQLSTDQNTLWIARSGDGAGNDGCWIHGNSSGQCYNGDNNSSWATTSDRRLKKNIVDSTKGLAEIEQLRVTNFEYRTEEEIDLSEFPLADNANQVVLGKGKEGKVQTGIIAQEVEEILPECITVSAKGAKTVTTDPIIWALVNAVKELSAKNIALEARLTTLEGS